MRKSGILSKKYMHRGELGPDGGASVSSGEDFSWDLNVGRKGFLGWLTGRHMSPCSGNPGAWPVGSLHFFWLA